MAGTLVHVADTAGELTTTYAPRLAEFVSDERFGAWRCSYLGRRFGGLV